MKRVLAVLPALMLLCCGCGQGEDPYRVDTVVRIPVSPTDVPRQTQAPTQAVTDPPGFPFSDWDDGFIVTEPPVTEEKNQSRTESPGKTDRTDTPVRQETEPPQTLPVIQEAPALPQPTQYSIAGYLPGVQEYEILDTINRVRTEQGLTQLELDTELCGIVSQRSYELSQYWSHTRPDGRDYATVLEDFGFPGEALGELSVYVSGGFDGASVAQKWLGSETHRQMLLMTDISRMGIGIFQTNGYTYICLILVK